MICKIRAFDKFVLSDRTEPWPGRALASGVCAHGLRAARDARGKLPPDGTPPPHRAVTILGGRDCVTKLGVVLACVANSRGYVPLFPQGPPNHAARLWHRMLACCERAQMEYRGARSPSWQCEGYGTGCSCASPIRRHHQPLTSTARARRGCACTGPGRYQGCGHWLGSLSD